MASKDSSVDLAGILNDVRDSLAPVFSGMGNSEIEQAKFNTEIANTLNDAIGEGFDSLMKTLGDLGKIMKDGFVDFFKVMGQVNIPVDPMIDMMKYAENLSSPLILDLDGDGVETQGLSVLFDHDGNGFAQLSGWVGKDDGLLVLDKNSNGLIENGSELFGNNSRSGSGELAKNGFQALSEYDINHDGIIDKSDEIYSKLQIWKDKNSNGVTDAKELYSLEQMGVVGIHLSSEEQESAFKNGNEYRQHGSFLKSDGTEAEIVDVWFNQDTRYADDKGLVAVSEEIARLPDIVATGNVSDLHQAMARSNNDILQKLVGQFIQEQDKSQRMKLAMAFYATGAAQ